MAFATNHSRFDLLNDDAPDPFEKKKKAKPSTTSGTQKKGAVSKGNGQTAAKKAKKKPNTNINSNTAPKQEEFPELGVDVPTPSNGNHQNLPKLPKEKRTKDQWSEWSKRDEEFVDGAFESELEAALFQSKLDFRDEQARALAQAKSSKKNKKKGVTVPLPEFNDLLTAKGDSVEGVTTESSNLNGVSDKFGLAGDDDDPSLAQFRVESQKAVQKQRQLELERKMLRSRSPIVPEPVQKTNKADLNSVQAVYDEIIREKDKIIAQLSTDKLELETEMDVLKGRFKRICSVLGDAQLKDKAKIVIELDKMTKLNEDLNENILELHGQLEQEKSKSSAAQLEIRKLSEQSRRRNPHSESVTSGQ